MVEKCCVTGCSSQRSMNSGLKLHKFPKQKDLSDKWVAALNKNYLFSPSIHTRICSKHFRVSDYITNFGTRNLKSDAIPTIFFSQRNLLNEFERTVENDCVSITTEKKYLLEGDEVLDQNLDTEHIPTVETSSKNEILYQATAVSIATIELEHSYCKHTSPITSVGNEFLDQPTVLLEPEKLPDIYIEEALSTKKNFELMPTKSSTPLRKRKLMRYCGDFKEEDLETPRKRKLFWNTYQRTIQNKHKKIKLLKQKNLRLQLKVDTLNNLVDDLQRKNKISANCSYLLKSIGSEEEKHLLMRQLRISKGKSITPELRKFALTLHFYSPSAYTYVRNIFSKALPDVSTLRKWCTAVNGLPGITKESLKAISVKAEEMKDLGKKLFGCLIMDEMSIKQHVQWTGSRHQGYVDYGPGGSTESMDNLPYAKDALVFVVVGMNTAWKIPVAYYLIKGITAEEKANILRSILVELQDTGIIIKTLTFDGAANNLAMASVLGASLYYPDLKPYFEHPVTQDTVHIVMDPCHMMKLLRNTLGDWGLLFNSNNEAIRWNYFKKLVNIQNESGVHAATKIRTRHIRYFKEKMKVSLAVQMFSNSVADAMLYCKNDLQMAEFDGAEPTIEFCRRINNIFDILNTRNYLSKSPYNKPISNFTEHEITNYIKDSIKYLESLQCLEKKPKIGLRSILKSERKTGFMGLIVSLTSLLNLTTELISSGKLSFILSYKFSQDHIEMLFSAIRARGGYNNNPTVAQFEAAYKAIIIHAEVKSSSNANCMALDDTSVLRVSSVKTNKDNQQTELLDLLCTAGTNNIGEDKLTVYQHSAFIDDIVAYIAGFVVRKLKKNILCLVCAAELESDSSGSQLLNRKNRGGLVKASNNVIQICKIGERTVREFKQIDKSNTVSKITLSAMKYINIENYFINLSTHILDQEPLNNHLLQLIKYILNYYITIRLHHINKSTNEIDDKIRSYYTKLILFKHQ